MAKEYFMTQCRLTRPSKLGIEVTTSWIPNKFATVGSIIDIKDKGVWSEGWAVTSAGCTMTADEALDRSQDYRHQREASDI